MANKCCFKYNDQGNLVARICLQAGASEPSGWDCQTWVNACSECPPYPSGQEALGVLDSDSQGLSQYAVLENDPNYYGDQGTSTA